MTIAVICLGETSLVLDSAGIPRSDAEQLLAGLRFRNPIGDPAVRPGAPAT